MTTNERARLATIAGQLREAAKYLGQLSRGEQSPATLETIGVSLSIMGGELVDMEAPKCQACNGKGAREGHGPGRYEAYDCEYECNWCNGTGRSADQ
jgi:DnaJ-class molecular chaperone